MAGHIPLGGAAEFYLGPMFSEKTSAIVRKIQRARIGGLDCVLIKNSRDNRYGEGPVLRTHGQEAYATTPATDDLGAQRVVEATNLLDVELRENEHDVGIDEGQFYPDLRDAVDKWTREGRRVYVAALDGNYLRKSFKPVTEALPLATRIKKLVAICMFCQQNPPAEAAYTVRTTSQEEEVVIGAKETYRSACLDCYLQHAR